MTKIKIKKQNENIVCVECNDHTGFGAYGSDIVCAGVSSITQTAVLAIQKLTNIKTKYDIDEKIGFLKLELLDVENSQGFHDAQVILKSMLLGLEDLQKQYPKHIKLEVK